jgi:hypothetical protein
MVDEVFFAPTWVNSLERRPRHARDEENPNDQATDRNAIVF